MSGALVTCPMEGMTGTMTGLGSVPLSSQGVLYGHALYIFSYRVPQRNGSRRVLKSEDRAKMTYSIPDLVSRNTTKNQEFFQVLESTSPRNQIKTYRDANPEF